jgi:hypothetical protein
MYSKFQTCPYSSHSVIKPSTTNISYPRPAFFSKHENNKQYDYLLYVIKYGYLFLHFTHFIQLNITLIHKFKKEY